MNLQRTLHRISSLEIQGAEQVATAALLALKEIMKKSKAKTRQAVLKDAEHARQQLVKTRPTEPELRNYLNGIMYFMREYRGKDLKAATEKRIREVLKEKEQRHQKIVAQGVKLLKKNMVVYTHCHSSTVNDILKIAKIKKIQVRNTETRPLFQGRLTAKELVKAKIPVTHFVDSAMVAAVKKADIILIGADAVTKDGVYNKIGSELLALLADHFHIPLYVCASLMKFDPKKEKIEQRSPKEVWNSAPNGITIHNPAFELIHFKHIKGIMCEDGILKPQAFIHHARKRVQH